MAISGFSAAPSLQGQGRMPGFTAESSVRGAIAYRALFAPNSGSDVTSAGSEICNCNCGGGCPGGASGGGGGTTGGGPPPPPPQPGVCECSSVLGVGCNVSSNHCNPGFVATCNCGLFSNACNCLPGAT
jgi:hypothetical protein